MNVRYLKRDELGGVPTEEEFPAIRLSDVERELARASAAGSSPAADATAGGPEPVGAGGDEVPDDLGTNPLAHASL